MEAKARHWYFNKRPKDVIEDDTLILKEEPIPALKDGEILIRSLYMSLDATNRVWMSDWDTYMDPLPLGARMLGFILGEVAESRNPAFPEGTLVTGLGTWSDWIVTDGEGWGAFPRPEGVSLADAFGILAVAGPTAYVGLLEIGKPKPGDTVVVTAAAGAVGALVGQIAKLHGCRVVGVAGSDDKCKWLTDELGFDAAINYRKENLLEALKREAPDGIDVQFENVGGEQLDAGLTLMNEGGRVEGVALASLGASGMERMLADTRFRAHLKRGIETAAGALGSRPLALSLPGPGALAALCCPEEDRDEDTLDDLSLSLADLLRTLYRPEISVFRFEESDPRALEFFDPLTNVARHYEAASVLVLSGAASGAADDASGFDLVYGEGADGLVLDAAIWDGASFVSMADTRAFTEVPADMVPETVLARLRQLSGQAA